VSAAGSPCEQGYEEQAQSYQIMEGAAEQAAQGENKASFDADLGAGIQGPRAGFKIASAMALLTDSAIETFLDEVRPVGKANGLLKEEQRSSERPCSIATTPPVMTPASFE
jgi:hypothetical protein